MPARPPPSWRPASRRPRRRPRRRDRSPPPAATRARLRAPTHHPKANKLWKITVTLSTRRLTSAHYEFFFNGQKVSTQYVNYNHHFKFRKRFSDPTIKWPPRAVGYPLTFRVVLHNACGPKNINYVVKVRR